MFSSLWRQRGEILKSCISVGISGLVENSSGENDSKFIRIAPFQHRWLVDCCQQFPTATPETPLIAVCFLFFPPLWPLQDHNIIQLAAALNVCQQQFATFCKPGSSKSYKTLHKNQLQGAQKHVENLTFCNLDRYAHILSAGREAISPSCGTSPSVNTSKGAAGAFYCCAIGRHW